MSRPNTKGGAGTSLKPIPPSSAKAPPTPSKAAGATAAPSPSAAHNDPSDSITSSPRLSVTTSKASPRNAKATAGSKLPPLNGPSGTSVSSPRLNPALIAAIHALVQEEALFRGPLEMQEACLFLTNFGWPQHVTQQTSHTRTLQGIATHCKGLTAHGEMIDSRFDTVGKALKQLHEDGANLRDCFERMLIEQKSEEKNVCDDLRVENKLLKRTLEEREVTLHDLQAELHALKDQLTRRILRNETENNFLRAMVKDQLQKLYLDVGTLRGQLHDRIDGCVASIQKASYANGALRQLQQLVEEDNRLIQERSTGLHGLIDEIGANDRFFDLEKDGSTMHSNFPGAYRVKLRNLTKEQLLNVLDVVSFEEGVVMAVGKALHARTIAAESTTRQQDATFAGQLISR